MIEEKIANYLQSPGKADTYISDSAFMEFYYLCSYIVFSSFSYLIETIQNTITSKINDTQTKSLWICWALVLYCVAAIFACYFKLLYEKKQRVHYMTFYSIIPFKIRENNAELKEHVKRMMKIYD